MLSPFFVAEELAFAYPSKQEFKFPPFSLEKGGRVLVVGPSGSGKSTFLHLLAGLRKPISGSVKLGDVVYSNLPAKKLDRFRGRHIGIVFQSPHYIRSLSVEDNLILLQQAAGNVPSRSRAVEVLSGVGLEHKIGENPNRLSLGEQQRLSLSMALINRPSLILADEPTSSLDDANCERVIELLKHEAVKNEACLVVITHDQRVRNAFGEVLTVA